MQPAWTVPDSLFHDTLAPFSLCFGHRVENKPQFISVALGKTLIFGSVIRRSLPPDLLWIYTSIPTPGSEWWRVVEAVIRPLGGAHIQAGFTST